MVDWTIEAYCDAQEPSDFALLPDASRKFLEALNLSAVHPFCSENAPDPYEIPGIPPQGPLLQKDHLESIWDIVVTATAIAVPSLAAMAELWIRLFASLIAPLGIAYLLYADLLAQVLASVKPTSKENGDKERRKLALTCFLSVLSSLVILTDNLYVEEFGPLFGASLLLASSLLAFKATLRHNLPRTFVGLVCLLLLTLFLVCDFQHYQLKLKFGHPVEHVEIDEGLYYDSSNPFVQKVVEEWPKSSHTYSPEEGATIWMPTGDSRTGLPFLLNHIDAPEWTRVWLSVDDGEVVALDICFPESGHDTSKPLYMILHGLNGGSEEEYVKDFAWRRTAEGSTVVVMIARGLMDLPVRGWDVFHGARWTDAHSAAKVLRAGLAEDQVLAGVGYSMGGIILSNYVAQSGRECALDTAVAISGGLDMRFEEHFYRAQRLWQPILATELRDTFVVGKWGERVRHRLTKDEMKALMRATHVTEVDKTAVVAYNGFRDVKHYYSEMSVLGDIPLEEYASEGIRRNRRVHKISIPLCVIHGLDDPLISWRTVAANVGLMHPTNLTKTGFGNLMILLTKRGGHVGWPLGWLPFVDKWAWMNNAAMTFVEAVVKAKASGVEQNPPKRAVRL